MVGLMVGMLSLCRTHASLQRASGQWTPLCFGRYSANEIWPKKATSVGTGTFGPVISDVGSFHLLSWSWTGHFYPFRIIRIPHVSVQVQVEPELGLLVDIVYSKAPTLQRHGQFSDFFGKYLLLNTAALKGNKCGLKKKTNGIFGKKHLRFSETMWCPGQEEGGSLGAQARGTRCWGHCSHGGVLKWVPKTPRFHHSNGPMIWMIWGYHHDWMESPISVDFQAHR